MRIHKNPKKAQHKPHKLDQNITSSSPIASKVNSMSQGDTANWDDDDNFMFTDSPSLNDTFEDAAGIAPLAEHFNLTKSLIGFSKEGDR